MTLGGRERIFLDKLAESGPLSDESLSDSLGDQASAADAAPITDQLAKDGLIQESEFAPRRWQITDAGQQARKQP
jgi:hypothetical protein